MGSGAVFEYFVYLLNLLDCDLIIKESYLFIMISFRVVSWVWFFFINPKIYLHLVVFCKKVLYCQVLLSRYRYPS